MTNSELTLDFLNKEMTKARRLGKELTDIVLGKQEMGIIRNWAYETFPSKKEDKSSIPNFQIDAQIWGVSLHEINKDSYFESFNLEESYTAGPSWKFDPDILSQEIIDDGNRMMKLIEENKLIEKTESI